MLAVFGTIIAVVSTAMLVYSIGYLGIANVLLKMSLNNNFRNYHF